MTTFLIVAALLAAPTAAFAQFGANPSSHFVPPHFNSDGSITQGYNATNPNDTTSDTTERRGTATRTLGASGAGAAGASSIT